MSLTVARLLEEADVNFGVIGRMVSYPCSTEGLHGFMEWMDLQVLIAAFTDDLSHGRSDRLDPLYVFTDSIWKCNSSKSSNCPIRYNPCSRCKRR